MTKADWLKLADAYIAEAGYWHELHKAKIRIAEAHSIDTDFIGTDYFSGPMLSAVENLLGDDFCYWCYDCDQSFEAFNKRVTFADGSHPNVRSLEELYEFAQEESQ
mgnify:CR=1 FL=1